MGEGDDDRVWHTIYLGPLPVEKIHRCLGIELAPAEVVFWGRRQEHAFKKEPHREPICSPHYKATVADPSHIGQQPRHKDKGFELVKVVPVHGPILLAIGLAVVKSRGRSLYVVYSTYPLQQNSLERRIRKGTTFVVPT